MEDILKGIDMLSSTVIETELRKFLSTAYAILFQRYLIFTAAMLVSTIVIPIFMVKILAGYERRNTIKAYLYKGTAKLGLHYAMIVLLPALAGKIVYQSVKLADNAIFCDKRDIWFSVLLIAFAFVTAYFLFMFRSRGLVLTGILVVLYAAYWQYLLIQRAKCFISISKNYNVVSKYGVFCAVNFLIWESMIISFSAVIIWMLIVVYYYKRRFLFTPGKIGMPVCGFCGKAICRGDDFCTNCGMCLEVNPIEQVIQSLDEEHCCRKCGRRINAYGCASCDADKTLRKMAGESTKKKIGDGIKKIAFFVILFLGLYFPILANPVGRLSWGRTKINNTFVSRWDEFSDAPEKATDPEWLAGFESDLNALYIADARWYYIKPELVPYDKLMYYIAYAEASFGQMKKLEQMRQAVYDVVLGGVAAQNASYTKALSDEFNMTIDKQASAMEYFNTDGFHIVNEEQANVLKNFFIVFVEGIGMLWFYVCSGFRYYAFRMNLMAIAVAVLIVDVCLLIYLLNSVSDTEETWVECLGRFCDVKADQIIQKYKMVDHPLLSDDILHRTVTAMKRCCHSFVHSVCKLWILVVQIICVIGIFMSLFRLQNIKKNPAVDCKWIDR